MAGTATSTFANGIALGAGCFKKADGACLMSTTEQIGAEVYLGSDHTSVAQDVWVDVRNNTELHDYGEDFNTGTYTYTVQESGVYVITGRLEMTGLSAATHALIRININNDTRTIVVRPTSFPTATQAGNNVVATVRLSSGDTVKLQGVGSFRCWCGGNKIWAECHLSFSGKGGWNR